MIGQVCDVFLTAVLIVLGILCFFCLIRSLRGPRLADRIVAVNMIGTMTMMSIAVLTVKQQEGFLADVALIYAMISFLAVVVVAKVYMGVYREKNEAGKKIPAKSPHGGREEDGTARQAAYQEDGKDGKGLARQAVNRTGRKAESHMDGKSGTDRNESVAPGKKKEEK